MNEDRIADFIILGAILFVLVLKIFGVIKISWFYILCPILILLGIGAVFAAILTIMYIIFCVKEKKENGESKAV